MSAPGQGWPACAGTPSQPGPQPRRGKVDPWDPGQVKWGVMMSLCSQDLLSVRSRDCIILKAMTFKSITPLDKKLHLFSRRFTGTSWPVTWPTWTAARTKGPSPRALQELTTPLSHLSYKRALLNAFPEFKVFKAWANSLRAWPCNKAVSAPDSSVSILFGLTVHQAHGTVLRNTTTTYLEVIIFGTESLRNVKSTSLLYSKELVVGVKIWPSYF